MWLLNGNFLKGENVIASFKGLSCDIACIGFRVCVLLIEQRC